MTYQHPAADRHQQAAWIAFARTESYEQISAAVPGLIEKIGYENSEQFRKAMALCVDSPLDEILGILEQLRLLIFQEVFQQIRYQFLISFSFLIIFYSSEKRKKHHWVLNSLFL